MGGRWDFREESDPAYIIPPLPTVNSLAASTNGQSINGNKADGGGDNAEENGGVMNNIMSDIQNGFVHRRLPDGGFKVCRLKMVFCYQN